MGHYKSNLRDLEFTLFEVLQVQERMGIGPYAEMDRGTAHDLLREIDRLARGPLSDSFAESDRNPPTFDPETHTVKLPAAFKKAYRALWEGEWYRLDLPTELGGFGAPSTLRWAASELMLGANPAVFMYMSGPSMAQVVHDNGTAEQRRWAQFVVDKGWCSTMVLTEADAGSDVGAGRTKAIQQLDGSWHIEGVKRFITSAEHDLADNIMHMVLARPEGPGITPVQGTKGLSLFLVPKYHFDTGTGELGERNGAFVTGVEHKMGLNASATCELTFGAHGIPAVGWLLGDVHNGIAQMFQAIEYARMMVGTKAIATLSSGYLNALEYAKQRVQGADITQMRDKSAPRVTIIHHPDVRRMLMLQKAYAEGLRALYLYTASYQDAVEFGGWGQDDGAAVGNTELAVRVNDLLLPLVKGVGSERASEMLTLSLQTLGGSGFLQDYPIEQYIRDAKIDSLYEGTTAIQSLDFFFRKIVRDRGQAIMHLHSEIQAFLDAGSGNGRLKEGRALLATALADLQAMLGAMINFAMSAQQDPRNAYKVGQQTVRLLMSTGDVVIGWLLLRQAEVALTALDGEVSPKDHAFYQGKVAVATFFARNILPELTARRAIVEATDNALMDVPEEAF
jgi:alkylation response protein AidB-like acyl-CoA dehydrogenase